MKVLLLPKVAWSVIFFIIQVINFAFLVGAMDYDYWFDQKWSIPGYAPYTFKGGLLGPYTNDLGSNCDDTDTYNTCYDNCNGDSRCELFKNWYGAGVAYVFFDSIASIIVVVMAIILVLDLLKVKFLKKIINVFTTAILMFVITGLHFLAFVIWAGAAKLQYSDCTHSFPYTGSKSVCGEGGSAFALWNLFYLCFVSVGYFLVACMIRREEAKEDENQSGGELFNR